VRIARWLVLLAVVAGGASGLLLSVGKRQGDRPYGDRMCEQLLRDWLDAWAGARACTADADCLVDDRPDLALCDRVRARAAPTAPLEAVERQWREAGCRMPEVRCPPVTGAACRQGRCAALVVTPSTPRP
jgi:hypothetical protein